jgi:hypothetical protein
MVATLDILLAATLAVVTVERTAEQMAAVWVAHLDKLMVGYLVELLVGDLAVTLVFVMVEH